MIRVRILTMTLLTLALQLPAFAQSRPDMPTLPEQTPQVVILSATPQPGNVVLHVTGRNLCIDPVVTFGGTPVAVTNQSDTAFDVLLPVGTQPGTYLLELNCGKGRIFQDTFIVVIQ
jgi:hypothetical protein